MASDDNIEQQRSVHAFETTLPSILTWIFHTSAIFRTGTDQLPLADEILILLPRMRRFSCMVLGSQERADECLRNCLKTVVTNPQEFNGSSNIETDLFTLLLKQLRSNLDSDVPTDKRLAATDLLRDFTPVEVQAFLLLHVEEFTPDDVEKILQVSRSELGVIRDKFLQKLPAATCKESYASGDA